MSRNHPTADGNFTAITVPDAADFATLSPRQHEVVDQICVQGKTQASAAFDLFIGLQTLKNHLTKIHAQTGKHSAGGLCFEYGRWIERRATKHTEIAHEYAPCPECRCTDGGHFSNCMGVE